ncbi:MAG TPA: hypothetical protein VF178_10905 [Gemmatimonadaceae bacterium]
MRRAAVGLTFALVATTLQAQRQAEEPTIRDSAGVRIVEHWTLLGVGPAFRVEARPFLDLGGVRSNPDEELDPVQYWLSATILSDGRIVVTERTQLKFFSRTGQFLGTAGRAGRGPAEFEQLQEVCRLPGDTLLAFDLSRRVSLWDPQGKHLRSFAPISFIAPGSCYPDRTVIAQVVDGSARESNASATTVAYARVRLDGTIVAHLGRLPTHQYFGTVSFEPSIIPSGDEVYVSDPMTAEIRVLDESGKIRRIIRASQRPTPITDDDWRRRAERSVPLDATAEQRAEQIAMMMRMKRPPHMPAFHNMRVDARRWIWLEPYEGDRPTWSVFDSTGRRIGQLELPWGGSAGARLVGIERDAIVVLRRDADGAPHLNFHRFTPPAGAGASPR